MKSPSATAKSSATKTNKRDVTGAQKDDAESLRECAICHAPMNLTERNFTRCVRRHQCEGVSARWHDRCLFRKANENNPNDVVRCPVCNDPATVDIVKECVSDIRNVQWSTDLWEQQIMARREEIRALDRANENAIMDAQRRIKALMVRGTCDAVLMELFLVALATITQNTCAILAAVFGWLGCLMTAGVLSTEIYVVLPARMKNVHEPGAPWRTELRETVVMAVFYVFLVLTTCTFAPYGVAVCFVGLLHAGHIVMDDVQTWRKNTELSRDACFTNYALARIAIGLKIELAAMEKRTTADPPTGATASTTTNSHVGATTSVTITEAGTTCPHIDVATSNPLACAKTTDLFVDETETRKRHPEMGMGI